MVCTVCLAGITALSLLLTPFLLQVSTRLILRGKGSGSGASDVELANLLVSAIQNTDGGCVLGWAGICSTLEPTKWADWGS